MIQVEQSAALHDEESRAIATIGIAKKDAQTFRHKLSSWMFNQPIPYEELNDNFDFQAHVFRIELAIEMSYSIAPMESSWLRARLNFAQSRRHTLFQKAYDISREQPAERLNQWATLAPILSELKTEIHLLPVEAEACKEFLTRLRTPDDRYRELQQMARDELRAMKSTWLDDEQLRGQRFLLEKLSDGLLRPSHVTLFDILRASERIRQRKMDIETYHTKGI